MSNKLSKSKQTKKEDSGIIVAEEVLQYAVAVLGIALSILVPLYLKNGYHGVGDCKYELYKVLMIIGTSVLTFLTILYFAMGGGKKKIEVFPTDWFVLAFLFFSLLAAIIGGNFTICFKGYNGWYMGVLAMFSFAVLYIFMARFGKYYKAILAALLCTSFITYVIGVLHRMMIDPIGTYGLGTAEEIADNFKNQFLSTLGQASWYSSFVCTVFPLGLCIFWFAKKESIRIASGIFSFVGCMTLITQNSDSAYLAMLGFFFVLFWFSAKDAWRMERFCEVLVLFFSSTRIMDLLLIIHPNKCLNLDAFSRFMVFSQWMWLVLLAAVLLWGDSIWLLKKDKYPEKIMGNVRIVLLAIIILMLACAIVILAMSAKGLLPAGLLAVTEKIPYMTWSDNWGNGRGRTWAFSIQMYKDMDVWHKLFGVGPDGYAPYAYNLYADRLEAMWGDRTLTNAHNEWMNSLINFGLFGVIAYIGIFVSSCVRFAKKQKDAPMLVGIIACVVSYMCHNAFCYQTVCCTPFIFLLMGIGMYIANNLHLRDVK